MTRVWNTPIFAIATVSFTVDALFSAVTGPITAWLSKQRLLEWARRWVTSLGPYQSLALFAVPVIILEPAKPLSAYLLGTGPRSYRLRRRRSPEGHRCGKTISVE
ncbi:hypothetical protein [Bradyrhizobium japonicum]|uniref:hypothetical protein n=1 Tax=Bradyrhizobium japonicum TaxID=375 RepID=UPI001BADA468|nr:hypothetical protein [Bradyrhizobium japonicum]MBR0915454.1 hypothetical protein [Bradyrhizobium japonicum]